MQEEYSIRIKIKALEYFQIKTKGKLVYLVLKISSLRHPKDYFKIKVAFLVNKISLNSKINLINKLKVFNKINLHLCFNNPLKIVYLLEYLLVWALLDLEIQIINHKVFLIKINFLEPLIHNKIKEVFFNNQSQEEVYFNNQI